MPDALPVAFVVNFADALRTMTRTGGEAPVGGGTRSSRSPTPSAQNGRASACARRWSTAPRPRRPAFLPRAALLPREARALARAQADVAARMQRGHAAVLERARAQQPHAAQPRPPEPPSTPPSAGGAAPRRRRRSGRSREPPRRRGCAPRAPSRIEQPAADCATAADGAVVGARRAAGRCRRCDPAGARD